jgi:hypothetical protein
VFVAPGVKEVSKYAASINYQINAAAFVAFYEQKGWKVGRNQMKNWQAAVRNWKANSWGGPAGPLTGGNSKPKKPSIEEVLACRRQSSSSG